MAIDPQSLKKQTCTFGWNNVFLRMLEPQNAIR
jgi:hypothetical protein